MSERVRRRSPSPPRTTTFAPTVQQRNQRPKERALQAAQRAKRVKPDMDWPAAIERLKAMLDRLEAQDG